MRTEDIKNMMITAWMIAISVAVVLSIAFQNIVIIKVVSVILGLGFSIIPFKDGLEFINKPLLFYLRKPTTLGWWEERCKFVINQP